MLRILFLILILTHSINFARAPENAEQKKNPTAEKTDDFGTLGNCEFGARIYNFFIELQKNPGATGYIILYQGANALPAEYEFNRTERLIRNHIMFRNYDASRIVFLNGVFRQELSTALWLVPYGADASKPTDTVPKPKIPTDKTFLFDRNYLQTEFDDASDEFILSSVKARIEEENRIAEEEYRRENPEIETEGEINNSEINKDEKEIDERSQEEIEDAKFHWINKRFRHFDEKSKKLARFADILRRRRLL